MLTRRPRASRSPSAQEPRLPTGGLATVEVASDLVVRRVDDAGADRRPAASGPCATQLTSSPGEGVAREHGPLALTDAVGRDARTPPRVDQRAALNPSAPAGPSEKSTVPPN